MLPAIVVVPLLVALLPTTRHRHKRSGDGLKEYLRGGWHHRMLSSNLYPPCLHVSLHSQLAQPPPGVIKIIRSKRVLQAKLAPTLLFCVVSQVHRSVSGAPQKLQTSAKPSASEPKSFKTALTWQKSARWFHDLMQEIDSNYSTYMYILWLWLICFILFGWDLECSWMFLVGFPLLYLELNTKLPTTDK